MKTTEKRKGTAKYIIGEVKRALKNAAWHIESGFAHGNIIHNTGMYAWDMKLVGVSRVPPSLKLEVDDPAKMSQDVKKVAKFFGASQVGICELDRRWVYSHSFHFVTREHKELELPEEYKYAIVMVFEMDYELAKTSPTWTAEGTEGKAYSMMPVTATMVAQFVRGLGYKAIPSGNDTAINILLAIDAGLGELGRNGLLITPQYGPRVRISKVLTDLPLVPDEPIEFGVTEYCEKCKKCAGKRFKDPSSGNWLLFTFEDKETLVVDIEDSRNKVINSIIFNIRTGKLELSSIRWVGPSGKWHPASSS